MKKKEKKTEIKRLDYKPSRSYVLDLEIFSVSNLSHRIGEDALPVTRRYSFYHLLIVTSGTCMHMIDFKSIHCKPRSLLMIRPGQAHRFGFKPKWEGWMVVFRPDLIATSKESSSDSQLDFILQNLQNHLELTEGEHQIIISEILQMLEDTKIKAPTAKIQELLRYKLSALLLRLYIYGNQRKDEDRNNSKSIQRFREFQNLVEKNFPKWQKLSTYVEALQCSEKSLSRATQEAVGMNAKEFLSSRINLEAKRLLAHTELSVTAIAISLGFDEATNFIKFFKREADTTPLKFRRKFAAEKQ